MGGFAQMMLKSGLQFSVPVLWYAAYCLVLLLQLQLLLSFWDWICWPCVVLNSVSNEDWNYASAVGLVINYADELDLLIFLPWLPFQGGVTPLLMDPDGISTILELLSVIDFFFFGCELESDPGFLVEPFLLRWISVLEAGRNIAAGEVELRAADGLACGGVVGSSLVLLVSGLQSF